MYRGSSAERPGPTAALACPVEIPTDRGTRRLLEREPSGYTACSPPRKRRTRPATLTPAAVLVSLSDTTSPELDLALRVPN